MTAERGSFLARPLTRAGRRLVRDVEQEVQRPPSGPADLAAWARSLALLVRAGVLLVEAEAFILAVVDVEALPDDADQEAQR